MVWRWLKQWWWTILLGVATVLGALSWLLMPRSRNEPEKELPKPFREKAKKEIDRVRLEGEMEKVKVRKVADSHKRQLAGIEKVGEEDPARARQLLAAWMNRNF